MTQIYLLKATTSADFNEPEYIGAGISEEIVNNWFKKVLENKWKNMDYESQQFYENKFDTYWGSWYIEIWPFTLAE